MKLLVIGLVFGLIVSQAAVLEEEEEVMRSPRILLSVVAVVLLAGGVCRAATLCVPDATPGGCDSTYATIALAVAAANAAGGDTIKCAAGTFPDAGNTNVTLDRPLTLLGAQAGVDARTRGPNGIAGAETVMPTSGRIFNLNAAGITIDGFMFPNLAFRALDSYANPDGLTLRNCIFKSTQGNNWAGGGNIQFGGPATLHANNFLFEQNYVQNTGSCDLLYMGHAMDNGTIRNNFINGISFAFGPFGARTGWLIEGNEFDGLFPGYNSATQYPGYGFNSNLGNVIIRNNNVHDMVAGIGQISVVGGSITNNIFGNNQWGAFQLWGGEYGSVVSANVMIEDNTITYNGGCTYDGVVAHGLRLRPGLDAATIHLHYNCFTNLGLGTCGTAWAIRQNGTGTADAELNWWGTTDSTTIASMMGEGTVDYDPWLSGVTYSGATQFLPTDSVVLAATVTSSNGAAAGVPVSFYVGGVLVGSATTDPSGVASFDWGTQAPGPYSVEAKATGDCLASTQATVTVSAAATQVPTASPLGLVLLALLIAVAAALALRN